jgi:hypothetical protein
LFNDSNDAFGVWVHPSLGCRRLTTFDALPATGTTRLLQELFTVNTDRLVIRLTSSSDEYGNYCTIGTFEDPRGPSLDLSVGPVQLWRTKVHRQVLFLVIVRYSRMMTFQV